MFGKNNENAIYSKCHQGISRVNVMSSRRGVRPITVHGGEMKIIRDDKKIENLIQTSTNQFRHSSWQESWFGEVSISSARASVMVYDDVSKRWIPSGSSSGLSKVQLYHHVVHNTFRVVGRKLQDHEIVINCAILKGLKYNQATGTFHQWRDNNQVYGLNFSSKDDADAFARAMLQALDVLNNGSTITRNSVPVGTPAGQQQTVYSQQPQQQQQQQQQPTSQVNTQYEEDMGYSQIQGQVHGYCTVGAIPRSSLSLGHLSTGGLTPSSVPPTPTLNQNHLSNNIGATSANQGASRVSPTDGTMRTMTREDVAIIQERRMSQQSQSSNGPNAISPSCPSGTPQQHQQQQQSGHHRTSSAPPAPQPQPPPMPGSMLTTRPQVSGSPVPPQPPAAPPAPPCPPAMMNFNAPVPPPMMNQYAQSPSQSNISNQTQSQPIYGTNQNSQYNSQSNQYASNSNQSQYSSQSSLYGGNNQNYSQTNNAQGSQYASSQNSQYAGNQYGSNSSINQYASSPNQFAQSQTQYGVVGQTQGQCAQTGNAVNPYGTPANSVNYASGPTANANNYAPISSNGPPPPPMASLGGPAAPPPPPPPPVPNTNANAGPNTNSTPNSEPAPDVNSLAAALQAAKLKKKQAQQSVENSGSSSSSGGSGGNYGTLGRGGGGGMASMMDEMAKTLARRRAAVEKTQPEQPVEPESSPDKKSWDKNNSANSKFSNGAESPKSARKRFGSASEDTLLRVNGVNDGALLTAQEMEAFKAEIIKEVKNEFRKMKQEIIEVMKGELNRR